MNKFRVLALGNEKVTRQLADSLGHSDTVELVCEPDLVEAVIRLRNERFALALVDGYVSDLATCCFRINFLHNTPLALITKDGDLERYEMRNLDVDGYVRQGSNKDELHSHFREIVQRGINQHRRIRQSVNVLIIENDTKVQHDVRTSFRFYWPEAHVFVSASGEDGVRMAERKAMDITILGFEPTGISGFKTLVQLRAVCQTPIVVLTEDGDDDIIVEAIRAGATGYLVKPFRQVEFMAKVRQNLRKRVPEGQSSANPTPSRLGGRALVS